VMACTHSTDAAVAVVGDAGAGRAVGGGAGGAAARQRYPAAPHVNAADVQVLGQQSPPSNKHAGTLFTASHLWQREV
jgi:hypothetical protein